MPVACLTPPPPLECKQGHPGRELALDRDLGCQELLLMDVAASVGTEARLEGAWESHRHGEFAPGSLAESTSQDPGKVLSLSG